MLVHVRIMQEHEIYAAQCLEYDICAQGNSPVAALENFRITMMGQVALDKRDGREPFQYLPCAPIFYWLGIEKGCFAGVTIDVDKIEPVTEQGG